MTIRSACLKFVDLTWKILAWSIIFLAVLISLAKLTIGNLQRYQPEIEHWLSEYSGIDVKTQTLQFGWRRYGPTLLIKNAEIQEADRQFHITIGRGFVVLDLFRSLWLGRPVAHQIEFQNVQARLNGQLAVTGENKLSGNQLLNWLLEQGDIQVYDTYVLLTHQQKKFTFATRALHYHGGQSRRALKTTILLAEQGKIDIRGRFFHRDRMSGDFYLRAHQVELAKLPLARWLGLGVWRPQQQSEAYFFLLPSLIGFVDASQVSFGRVGKVMSQTELGTSVLLRSVLMTPSLFLWHLFGFCGNKNIVIAGSL